MRLHAQEVGERRVRHHDALGASGGAGGVDDVRGVRAVRRAEPLGVGDRVRGQGREGGQGVGSVQDDGLGARHVRRRGGGSQGGQHTHRAGVADHVVQPVGRVVQVQRQIGAARPQHRQQGHQQVRGARQRDADVGLGPGTARDQQPGDPVRALVQLRVGQFASVRDDGGPCGVCRGLRGDGVHDRARFHLPGGGFGRVPQGAPGPAVHQLGRAHRGAGAAGREFGQETVELGAARGEFLRVVGERVGVQLEAYVSVGRVVVQAEGEVVDGSGGDVVRGAGRAREVQGVVERLDVDHRAEQSLLPADESEVAPDVLGPVALVGAEFADQPGGPGRQFSDARTGPDRDAQRQYVHHHRRHPQGRRAQPGHGGQGQQHVPGAGGAVQERGERRRHRVRPTRLRGTSDGVQTGGRLGGQHGAVAQEGLRGRVRGTGQQLRFGPVGEP